ncbi:hypothetical protein JP36_11295 [Gallibacterium genomosp. 1]|uniref:Uncharacterized protein n=1 Tax=Gallibacterium genomosp. 1 TaxID=155515 RepID=A0A0A2YCF1_9PAST|nr:hypothetical protein JP36_11295 [Gallibacterium genomosp. 1]
MAIHSIESWYDSNLLIKKCIAVLLSAPPTCQVENVWIADSVFPSACAFMAKRVFLTMIGILTIVPYVLGAM